MPALTFDIREGDLSGLQDKKNTVKDFLAAVLIDKNKDALTDISPWLLEFHKQDGGSPVVSGVKIAGGEFDFITYSGKVKLTYKVSVSYGCADIFRTDDHTETCKFYIDPQKNKLTLFITDQLYRDTVDEF